MRGEIPQGLSGAKDDSLSKTHRIETVIGLMPPAVQPGMSKSEQALLTEYGVAPRYPFGPDLTLAEARRAVAMARAVRKHVRSLLPKAALSRR